MLPFPRWQWLWESRVRLLTFGLVVMAVGGVCLAHTIAVWPKPMARGSFARLVAIGILLLPVGGYPVLQAVLSPAGAFGGHDDPVTPARRKPKWRGRRSADPPPEEPIPLADESLREARCPMCDARVTVPADLPPDGTVRCPTCSGRFAPD